MQASNKDSSVQDGDKTGMMLGSSQCGQGHTGGLTSKRAQESVLCHSLACFVAYVWLESGVSTEQESCLLQRSHASRGRIRQYLLGTIGGNKPARSTPTSPLK